ncbi:MAG TPA: alanine racemase [Phycisphaerales bacterium]|nr:alanine racemase [Phycisphaerales bacterium]HMP36403.1 alanine racemase [Phycisphaerales bacterium]
MRDTSVVEVNLSAIDRNMRALRALVGDGCGLCPIVKADAYGLGSARIGRRLAAAGADLLAVYSPEQAAVLARAAVGAPILVLMPLRELTRTDELYRPLVLGQLHLVVHDLEHLETLIGVAERFGAVIPVHIEIDTGMSRGGAAPAIVPAMLERLAATPWLAPAGIFTHFSDPQGDLERMAAQLAEFDAVVAAAGAALPESCVQHVASTYALLRHRRFHRKMVRFGLAWAGYGADELASADAIGAAGSSIEPVVTWSTRLVHVKRIEAGTGVGYGSRWTAPRSSVIGLVPAGYADGYPRVRDAASGAAQVAVILGARPGREGADEPRSAGPEELLRCGAGNDLTRRFAPVVGAVNMDQITIDLTEIAAEFGLGGALDIGTRVELISPDPTAPNHLPRVAAAAGTIPHEMLCRLSPSLRRVYFSETASFELEVPALREDDHRGGRVASAG